MTAPREAAAAADRMSAPTDETSVREALARGRHADVLRHMREAHVLWGQMIVAAEACDFVTVAALNEIYARSVQAAGASMVCLDAVFSSEGSA